MRNLFLGFAFSVEDFRPLPPKRALVSASGEARRDAQHRPAPDLPPEIAFLTGYGVGVERLAAINASGDTVEGAEIILMNEGGLSQDEYYFALAEHLNVPFFGGEFLIAQTVDLIRSVLNGVAPLSPNRPGLRAVLAPRGAAICFLLEAHKAKRLQSAYAIATPQSLGHAVRARKGGEIAAVAAQSPTRYRAEFSARTGLSKGQILFAAMLLIGVAFYAWRGAPWIHAFVLAGFWIIFGAAIVLRLLAVVTRDDRAAPAPLSNDDLPIYSIVTALYNEAKSVRRLVAALDALDYPKSKLDIKIVVEKRDRATQRAIARLRLPLRYDVIIAPPGEPSTKPRALNIALPYARGEFLVVFDAEDTPAADQLRLAAARFVGQPELDCLQARLTIDNAAETWVTKLFAIEYAVLFDLINPGLAALEAPMALGGSSNHFRTHVLREVGGWDAWNLTEDADLGLRLAQFRRNVDFLDSDTREEAPLDLKSWFQQRVRWQKGWMQTLIVHSRHPLRLLKRLGLRRFACATALVLGGVLAGLMGPWLMAGAIWRLFTGQFTQMGAIDYIADILTYALLFSGAQALFIPAFVAVKRRGLQNLTASIALLPIYYLLISLASWAAIIDLFVRPFYWAKTEHGRTRMCQGVDGKHPIAGGGAA